MAVTHPRIEKLGCELVRDPLVKLRAVRDVIIECRPLFSVPALPMCVRVIRPTRFSVRRAQAEVQVDCCIAGGIAIGMTKLVSEDCAGDRFDCPCTCMYVNVPSLLACRVAS